jgi:hypothetical protein
MKLKSATDNPFATNVFDTPRVDPNCALPQPIWHVVEANKRNHREYFLHVSVFAFARRLYQWGDNQAVLSGGDGFRFAS